VGGVSRAVGARVAICVEAALARRPDMGEYVGPLLGRIKFAAGRAIDLAARARCVVWGARCGVRARPRAAKPLDLARCHARRKAWQASLEAARSVLVDFRGPPECPAAWPALRLLRPRVGLCGRGRVCGLLWVCGAGRTLLASLASHSAGTELVDAPSQRPRRSAAFEQAPGRLRIWLRS